jgi:hypothetical protein
MTNKRVVRIALWTVAAAVLFYALLADPTGVGRNRQTYFRATIANMTNNDILARRLAYVINQYTLLSAALIGVSLAFREPRGPASKTC